MTETYYAGTYWLARQEPAEACARRAELLFQLLGRCDSAWNHWHDTKDSEEAQEPGFNPDASAFTRMFGRKEYQQGPDGFRFGFWVGNTVAEATSIDVRCGTANVWLSSMCVLTSPSQGPVAKRVLTASVMAEVLRAMALAWEPEWGVVTSHEHLRLAAQRPKAGTFVGWVMYFSRLRGPLPPLPAPVRIEPVEDLGSLVILTPERFSASNPEHVALAARVHALLHEAGLLRPLQPLGPA